MAPGGRRALTPSPSQPSPDLTDADLEAIAPAWAHLRDYGEIADRFEKASKEKNT